MSNTQDDSMNTVVFWQTSRDFLYVHHEKIRKSSPNTVKSYKTGINQYISFLETEKEKKREDICFNDFKRDNLKLYTDWMLGKKLADKTCNLRLTALHSLLEYAAYEYADIMPVYINALTVKGVKLKDKPIEFFESAQMKGLLDAPDTTKTVGRRNRMILVMFYDTGGRVQEIIDLTVGSLHLEAGVPYVTLHGKGDTFRNVPLMDKTVRHLKSFLKEFHEASNNETSLFYAHTHGRLHQLSPDTMENLIKDSAQKCIQNGIDMPDSCHCHMIRKTRAMDLYQAGMSLEHIQQLLGHKHISTTSGFYAFATLETLSTAMKKAGTESESAEKRWMDEATLEKLYSL